jgi:hypothetical protein
MHTNMFSISYVNPTYVGFVLHKLNANFIPHLLSHIRKSFKPPIHTPPPLGGILVLSITTLSSPLVEHPRDLGTEMALRAAMIYQPLLTTSRMFNPCTDVKMDSSTNMLDQGLANRHEIWSRTTKLVSDRTS